MAIVIATQAEIWEDGGASFMARIVGNDAVAITQAAITAITCAVVNAVTLASVATPTIAVASTVFDSYQTDARWTVDTTGYNFRHDMPASSFATGDTTYEIDYLFDPVSGENFPVVFRVHARSIAIS